MTWLIGHWSHGSSCTDHVFIRQWSVTDRHWSWDCARTDHVALMHWWRDCACTDGWSGTDHMAHHALITCLSGNDQWLTGADHGTVHALITWLSCTDHVTISSWVSFGNLWVLRNWSNLRTYLELFCGVCSDISSFVPDIGSLCLFSSWVLLEVHQFFLIFSINLFINFLYHVLVNTGTWMNLSY